MSVRGERQGGEVGLVEPRGFVPSRLPRAEFVAAFGHVFRNGAWISEQAWDKGLTAANDTPEGVYAALTAQFRGASDAQRLEVIKGSTPLELRVNVARIVDDARDSELVDVLTAVQKAKLLELFEAYRRRFGFDVIFLVRNYTTVSLLRALEERLDYDHDRELATTLVEVEALAQMYIRIVFNERARA